jgi:GTP-binding protein
MPQTRFVLKKALEFGHAVVVVVNKIDRPSARPEFVVNSTFELFIELNASDEQVIDLCLYHCSKKLTLFIPFLLLTSCLVAKYQCDFQTVYASGIKGKAGLSPDDLSDNLGPLFEAILRCIPEPLIEKNGSMQMLVSYSLLCFL